MSRSRSLLRSCIWLASALIGCTAPVAQEPDEVGATEQALNMVSNFKIGLMDIYYSSTGALSKATPVQTESLMEAALSAFSISFSNLTQPDFGFAAHPNGVRISLTNLGAAQEWVQGLDFRIGVQAQDAVSGYFSNLAPTRWASEGPSCSDIATDDDRDNTDRYVVYIETRAWPGSVRGDVTTFQVGVRGCETVFGAFTNQYCGATQWTSSLYQIARNATSWSHTAQNKPGTSLDGVSVCLSPRFGTL